MSTQTTVSSASHAATEPVAPCRHLHKFGGSSLADASRIRAAAALVAADGEDARAVVVSAMQGVTDALVALAALAREGGDWQPAWSALRNQHRAAAAWLVGAPPSALHDAIDAQFDSLRDDLASTVAGAGHLDARIWGVGELCSSWLMHAALGGAATTLGRNGSDYSAAIFASLLGVDELTIWTDVDGVLSADPRVVPDAVCLPSMSYAEACELAYFGAKVLHPQTLAPVQERGIPLRIRNARNPCASGTRVVTAADPHDVPVKGLSLVDGLAVLELVGNGMVGVPGIAERLFAALHRAGVSVTMISQGSSEHSICCVVRADQADRGRDAIIEAFHDAMADTRTQAVHVTRDICVLAAVGDGMVGVPGVAARLLGGLAQARVNVRAIAQGASERNISVAVAGTDATRALRAAHAAFWLSPQTISIGVIGPGQVGRALLAQLAATAPRLRDRAHLDLRLRAVCDSRRMHLSDAPIAPEQAIQTLAGTDAVAADLDAFAAHVRAEHLPHALIVDCSASDAVAAKYAGWLAAGIHVVTPNKLAGSGDWPRYAAIRDAQQHGGRFLYEATVDAGLPVILTLRSLLDTGDVLQEVDGMLSGTLAWLFNSFDGRRPFSELVLEARALGYTEPDPRDDLSGLDVSRKLVILAREAGRMLSLADVEVENLVPEHLRKLDRDAFLARVGEMDAPMQARLDAAHAQGLSLRHIARLDAHGRATVGVVALPSTHACCHTRLTDNLVQFRSDRYAENPLVVQGPGAGPEVTAAGVFGDLLTIAQSLGAKIAAAGMVHTLSGATRRWMVLGAVLNSRYVDVIRPARQSLVGSHDENRHRGAPGG